MKVRRLAILNLISLIAGCHVTIPVHINSVLLSERGNQTLALPVGERMRSDDRVAVVLQVDRSAHVYVFQLKTSGLPELIYPEQEDERVVARFPLRIPAQGSFTTAPNLVVIVDSAALSTTEQQRRVEKAARKPRQARPGQSRHPIVLGDVKGPPGSIGEVRSGEELRRIVDAFGTTADVAGGDGSALRLWLTSE